MIKRDLIFERQSFTAYDAEQAAKAASRYQSEIFVLCGQRRANVKSLIGLISVRLEEGTEFTLTADGRDEQEALDAVLTHF